MSKCDLCPEQLICTKKSLDFCERNTIKKPSKKHDQHKLMYDLIPPIVLEELARVLTYGADKYGPGNWKNLPQFKERYYSALMRHLQAFRKGEQFDPESGLHHLSHAITNIAFLLTNEQIKNGKTNTTSEETKRTIKDSTN